ncbi:Ig-like domain-containing protein [Paenibacillus sp. J22TS3]|uniref:Ig-like domain-containing protein n=1 Tax=Paenibacillus sp. J22TS3 TaxID=2807192 RepID=UPI001B218A1C|nr:Ig-like domain-containing protein [Paenibacillus sp. J22TS3]GIP23289.1 hypothetical protein J22TS3_35640 [Paenibacillus sp. J22TS3]
MFRSIIRKASVALLSLTLVSGIAASHGYASSAISRPVVEWSQQYGMDQWYVGGSDVISTLDGGYVVTSTITISPNLQGYIVKLDSSGKLQWEQKIQHNNKSTSVDKTIETKDGGFLVCGTTENEHGKNSVFLLKLSPQGTVEWEKDYEHDFSVTDMSIAETKDNGFVVTGQSWNWPDIQYGFVLKTDAKGQQSWLKKLSFNDENDYYDIIATQDGGSIAVGTQHDRHYNDPKMGAIITKLNEAGEEVWTKKLSEPDSLRMAFSIVSSGDGGYMIYGTGTDQDQYLTRIDANGKVLWDKKFDPTPDNSFIKKVVRTNDGYALFSEYKKGSTNVKERKYELFNIDDTGKILKQSAFSVKNFERMVSVTVSREGGFVLLGETKGAKNNTFIQVTKLAVNNQPGEPTVESISFTDSSKTIGVGELTAALVNAHYSDGTKELIKEFLSLSSENERVAIVDSRGFITGIKPGNTVINAVYEGHRAQLKVEVVETPNHGDPDQWSYLYGKNQYFTTARSIIPASDGGYIIAGNTQGEMFGGSKAYILKLNAAGVTQWQQMIQHGMSEYTEAYDVVETQDGGILVSGTTRNYDDRPRDVVFMAKLSAQGVVEWEREFEGGANRSGDAVAETKDGGFVVTGYTLSASGEDSAYVLKTDAHGQQLWNRTYRFGNYQNYNDIIATPDGGSIAVGTVKTVIGSNEDDGAIVTKLGTNGEEVWTKKLLPIGREAYSILSANEDSYLIASRTRDGKNYLTKINDTGEVIWEKSFEASKGQFFHKIVRYGQGYTLLGAQSTGNYPDTETRVAALKLDDNGQILGKILFTEPNLSNLDKGTVTQDGKFVLMGAVKINNQTLLKVAKTSGQDTPVEPVLTGISFSDTSKQIAVGETATSSVRARYSDGTEKALTESISFTSEDENTASVDSKGLITGVKPGSTVIHAVYQGLTAQLPIEVTKSGGGNPDPEGTFYLDSEEYSLTEGTSIDTVALFKDKDGKIHDVTKQSIFKSENPAIVDYDKDGNINGVRAGITYITAEYQGKTYRALVQVVRASVPN